MRKSLRRSPSFEGLEGRALMSVVLAETENNDRKDRADVFTFDADRNVQLRGVSTSKNDRDFFVFTAPATGTLNATVGARNGAFAQLEIEDRAGNTILETQPNNGSNARSATVQAGATYFIRLRAPRNAPAAYAVDLLLGGAASAQAQGQGLSVPSLVRESQVEDHLRGADDLADDLSHEPEAERGGGGNRGGGTGTGGGLGVAVTEGATTSSISERESNDSKAAANAFTLSSAASSRIRGVAAGKDDRDFFTFVASQSGTVSVRLQATGGRANVEVENAQSVNLLELENGATTGRFAVTAGNRYFLRLRAADKAQVSYDVELTLS